jgi:hypothetical protein
MAGLYDPFKSRMSMRPRMQMSANPRYRMPETQRTGMPRMRDQMGDMARRNFYLRQRPMMTVSGRNAPRIPPPGGGPARPPYRIPRPGGGPIRWGR